MSDYYESEIEPIIGMDFDNLKKKSKIKKVKMKCNKCGCIDYTLRCPKCGYGMVKYHNPF
jgi:ssDNA-binding Zn-finger/Zn-ribbon topoisomerase 1